MIGSSTHQNGEKNSFPPIPLAADKTSKIQTCTY